MKPFVIHDSSLIFKYLAITNYRYKSWNLHRIDLDTCTVVRHLMIVTLQLAFVIAVVMAGSFIVTAGIIQLGIGMYFGILSSLIDISPLGAAVILVFLIAFILCVIGGAAYLIDIGNKGKLNWVHVPQVVKDLKTLASAKMDKICIPIEVKRALED